MAKIKTQNQQNPPLSKKKRVDSMGNDARRVYVRSGTGSIAEAIFPNENAAKAYIEQDRINIKNLGGKVLYDSKYPAR